MFKSTKNVPYVYILTHKTTNQFYIGFRCANKVPSSDDIGKFYFTSSKFVKNNFQDFEIKILAEFFDKDFAYEYEQNLIKENFNNPLILNKHWQSTKKYSMLGFKRNDLVEYNKLYKTKPKEIRTYKCVECQNVFERTEFCHHTHKKNPICSRRCNGKFNGKHSKKITGPQPHLKGRPSWNKGIPNPQAADNARKGASKLSKTVTGRKRQYREDGSWYWVYPNSTN